MATLVRISVDFHKQHRWHDRSRWNLFVNIFTAWDIYWYIKQNRNACSKTLMKKSSFNKSLMVFVGQENLLRTIVKLISQTCVQSSSEIDQSKVCSKVGSQFVISNKANAN